MISKRAHICVWCCGLTWDDREYGLNLLYTSSGMRRPIYMYWGVIRKRGIIFRQYANRIEASTKYSAISRGHEDSVQITFVWYFKGLDKQHMSAWWQNLQPVVCWWQQSAAVIRHHKPIFNGLQHTHIDAVMWRRPSIMMWMSVKAVFGHPRLHHYCLILKKKSHATPSVIYGTRPVALPLCRLVLTTFSRKRTFRPVARTRRPDEGHSSFAYTKHSHRVFTQNRFCGQFQWLMYIYSPRRIKMTACARCLKSDVCMDTSPQVS